MARLDYLDPERASEEVRDELVRLGALGELNLTRMLAHADKAFLYYGGFAGTLMTQGALNARLREFATLLVAHRCESQYEWAQHVALGRACGIDEDQISAIAHDNLSADCLDEDARIVLSFTAQILDGPRPDDHTFALLAERLSPREIVELLMVIGNYQMLARIMTALDIEIDPVFGLAAVDVAKARLD